jgi:hypothetical protein
MFHHIQYIRPDDTGNLFTFDGPDPFFRNDHTIVLPVNFIRHKLFEYITTGNNFVSCFLGEIVHCNCKLIRSAFDVNGYCTPFHYKQLKGVLLRDIPQQVKLVVSV